MQQRKSCPLPIHWVTTVDSEESVDLAYLSCDSGNLKILKLNLSLTVGNLKILKLDLSCDCQNLKIFKICGSVLSLVNFCEVTMTAIIYRKT
jgi:hypothetical protein